MQVISQNKDRHEINLLYFPRDVSMHKRPFSVSHRCRYLARAVRMFDEFAKKKNRKDWTVVMPKIIETSWQRNVCRVNLAQREEIRCNLLKVFEDERKWHSRDMRTSEKDFSQCDHSNGKEFISQSDKSSLKSYWMETATSLHLKPLGEHNQTNIMLIERAQ